VPESVLQGGVKIFANPLLVVPSANSNFYEQVERYVGSQWLASGVLRPFG
jgi:hypothetical protein